MEEPMLQDMREDANLLLTAPPTPIPSKTWPKKSGLG